MFLTPWKCPGSSVREQDRSLTEGVESGKTDPGSVGSNGVHRHGSSEAMGPELSRGKLLRLHMELDKGFFTIAPLTGVEFVTIIAITPKAAEEYGTP